jgi:hypothetical protein
VTPEDDARAFTLVREQGLSYSAAGKMFKPARPKTTIRAAVTREAVRRARVAPPVPETPPPAPAVAVDTGFMARVLAAGPLPTENASADDVVTTVPDRLHLDTDDEPDDDLDFGVYVRKQIRKLERLTEQLEAEGNIGEAQKYSRTMAVYVAQLRQHEKTAREDDGVMTYTLADVEAVRADLRQKVRDVQHRGLVCADCGAKMRRKEAEGEDE